MLITNTECVLHHSETSKSYQQKQKSVFKEIPTSDKMLFSFDKMVQHRGLLSYMSSPVLTAAVEQLETW